MENHELTPEQEKILAFINKQVAKDLTKPQQLTPEEEALLDILDAKDPPPPINPDS